MILNGDFLFAFLCVFSRCSAMLLTSPLFGHSVPVNIRVQVSMVLSFALTSVLQPKIGGIPPDIISLFLIVIREVLIGLLIGSCLQLVTSAAESAGSFADMQLGLSSAAMFNPMMGSAATPLARYKYMLAVVLLFTFNAHHVMLSSFVQSYDLSGMTAQSMKPVIESMLGLLGSSLMLAIKISAPVAGVCVLVDLAAGFINKAVPQTQPFLLALPAKLAIGLTVLAVGLPALSAGIRSGVDIAFSHLSQALGGG